jgi:hypothetical protein
MYEAPGASAALTPPVDSPSVVQSPGWITAVLRTNAVLFVGFFGFAFIAVALDIPLGERLEELTQWGQQGRAYELMITSVYAVWGCYLWAAARSPQQHRLFLGFTVTANVVHFSVMLLEAVLMKGEHLHLVGDVLVGWVSVISLAVAVRALGSNRTASG